LSEAHDRTTDIERKLKERFGDTTHITIHMEPTNVA
ncbi:MAG: cation-efflux pump, partial [Muribaculaceae bacterium]|nr:cation-efflux pump [Muribaculaceae bacterium]